MTIDVSALFGALADTRRRAILDLLGQHPLTVNRIAEEFSVSRPAISRHLRVLREAGLVREEKRGRERLYELEQDAVREAVEVLEVYLPTGQRSTSTRSSARRRSQHPEDGWRCW